MMAWQQWPATWSQTGSQLLAWAGKNGRAVLAVNLALILVLSYHLADLSWYLAPTVEQVAIPVKKQTVVPRQQQPTLNVARWHLFGEYQSQLAISQSMEDIPETKLKLVLRGVFSGDGGGASGAIIASPSGKQAFYSLGADLPGGAVLKEVYTRHIVLLRNGRLETLHLPQDKLKNQNRAKVEKRQSSNRTQSRSVAKPQRSLREYRNTLLENPQQLNDVFQVSPYRRKGISGYQVNPGRDAALFSRLGLEPNDVIIAVNGIPLDSPIRSLSVLQTLKKDGPVMVDILRGGVPQTLSVNINQ